MTGKNWDIVFAVRNKETGAFLSKPAGGNPFYVRAADAKSRITRSTRYADRKNPSYVSPYEVVFSELNFSPLAETD